MQSALGAQQCTDCQCQSLLEITKYHLVFTCIFETADEWLLDWYFHKSRTMHGENMILGRLWVSDAEARASLINKLNAAELVHAVAIWTHTNATIYYAIWLENQRRHQIAMILRPTTPYTPNAFYQQPISRASCFSATNNISCVSECIFISLLWAWQKL